MDAINGINWGCLPSPQDMVDTNEQGFALSCHSNQKRVCSGLKNYIEQNSIKEGKLLTHHEWANNGLPNK